MHLLAIDPGTTESAYVVMRGDYSPLSHAKVPNDQLLELIALGGYDAVVIEHMEARTLNVGKKKDMPPQKIGKTTYDTCIWIGRFKQVAIQCGMDVHEVYRSEEKSRIIPTKKNRLPPLPSPVPDSTDSKIRHGLIARFAKFDKKNGKGNAAGKDTFYGFKADEWSAFAVGVVYLDKARENSSKACAKA